MRSTSGCSPSGWCDPHELAQQHRPGLAVGVGPAAGRRPPRPRNVPVQAHTDHGLPVREPGARLVPGAADGRTERRQRAGTARRATTESAIATATSSRRPTAGAHRAPVRDPEAVRASISSHFGGVRAGRSHARDTRSEEPITNDVRSTQPHRNSLDWLVSKFARDVPGVSHAMLVSADGLLIAASEHLPQRARRPARRGGVGSGQPVHRRRATVRRRPGAAVGRRDGERLPAADARRRRLATWRRWPPRRATSARSAMRWPSWSNGWAASSSRPAALPQHS